MRHFSLYSCTFHVEIIDILWLLFCNLILFTSLHIIKFKYIIIFIGGLQSFFSWKCHYLFNRFNQHNGNVQTWKWQVNIRLEYLNLIFTHGTHDSLNGNLAHVNWKYCCPGHFFRILFRDRTRELWADLLSHWVEVLLETQRYH